MDTPPSHEVIETMLDYISNQAPSTTAPRSDLHVTEEMKKNLARTGFIRTKDEGNRLRRLYINQSIGFNPEKLSLFGRNYYYGVLREVVQEFEKETAPLLSAKETEYQAGVYPKTMVVKVQVPDDSYTATTLRLPTDNETLIYTEKKDCCFVVRRSNNPKACDMLSQAVRTKGASGLKPYFSAILKSKEELVITIPADLVGQPF